MMTLAGLAIAIGRVVDDGIVVLENMYRHIQAGESNVEAGLKATREVGGSVFGSTIATIAVFAPLVFIPGVVGQLFVPLAASVTFALLASTIVALTVVPVMGSMLLRVENDPADAVSGDSALQRLYTPLLRWTLGHKIISIAGSVLLVAGAMFLLPRIPIIFLPETPPSYIQIDLELPPGTGIKRTFDEIILVEQVLDGFIQEGAVMAYQATLGAPRITSGPGANATGFEFATFIVSLPPEFPEDLEEGIRSALPQSDDVEFTVNAVTSASVPARMELTVSGPRFSDVAAVARRLETGCQRD